MPYNSLTSRTEVTPLIPESVSAEIFQALPTESSVLALARRLPDIPVKEHKLKVLSALPIAYFVDGDTGLKQTTNMDWDNVTLTAEEIAVICPIPEAVLDDSGYPIWDQARPRMVEAAAKVIDAAMLVGTNAPASWPNSLHEGAVAASQTVDHSSVSGDYYDEILGESGLFALVEADGYDVNGIISTVQMKGALRGLRDQSGAGIPIFQPIPQNPTNYQLGGVPMHFNKNGALPNASVHMIAGDFNQLVYAWRQDITWKILDQAVIPDEAGNIVYNLAQQDMVALRMVLRLGFAVPNPVNQLNSNSSTRYPFAALVP